MFVGRELGAPVRVVKGRGVPKVIGGAALRELPLFPEGPKLLAAGAVGCGGKAEVLVPGFG
jgi:hypothetical protein